MWAVFTAEITPQKRQNALVTGGRGNCSIPTGPPPLWWDVPALSLSQLYFLLSSPECLGIVEVS